jgi:spermidine synthase
MLYFHENFREGSEWVRPVKRVLWYGKTDYQDLAILECENLGVVVFSDSLLQTDERFRDSYHRHMLAPCNLETSRPKCLVVGGGTNGLSKEIFNRWPEASVIEVEIDAQAYALYQQLLPHWGMTPEQKVKCKFQLILGDAYQLDTSALGPLDLVAFDIDIGTRPGDICASACKSIFFGQLRDALRPGGWFVSQAGPVFSVDQDDVYTLQEAALKKYFPSGSFFDWREYWWRFFAAQKPLPSPPENSCAGHE